MYFYTKFTYNEYIGPCFLSHVVIQFSPSDLPGVARENVGTPGNLSDDLKVYKSDDRRKKKKRCWYQKRFKKVGKKMKALSQFGVHGSAI